MSFTNNVPGLMVHQLLKILVKAAIGLPLGHNMYNFLGLNLQVSHLQNTAYFTLNSQKTANKPRQE